MGRLLPPGPRWRRSHAGLTNRSGRILGACSGRSSSPTAARSRSGSSARCDELGIASVAVYSELDRDAPHVARAGEAYLLGGAPPAESYLNVERILEVVARVGRRGHPSRLRLPRRERGRSRGPARTPGIVFIGPPADAIDAMGSKTRARELMRAPACRSSRAPSSRSPTSRPRARSSTTRSATRSPSRPRAAAAARAFASRCPRTSSRPRSRAPPARARSSSPTRPSTSSATCPTRATSRSRSSPTRTATTIHLGERDCSIQRRHQKLIEESPAPAWIVDEALRERIGKIAVEAARGRRLPRRGHGRGPAGAGSERVLLPRDEHARAGRALRDGDDDRRSTSSRRASASRPASRCRSPGGRRPARPRDRVPHQRRGRVEERSPRRRARSAPTSSRAGPGVRVDSGVRAGSVVSPMYDPMVAKLIVWDADREQATARMLRALAEYRDRGPQDADPVSPRAAGHRAVGARRDLPRPARGPRLAARRSRSEPPPNAAGDDDDETVEQTYTVEVSGRRFDVSVIGPPAGRAQRRRRRRAPRAAPKRAAPAQAQRAPARQRHARLADAGQRLEGPGRARARRSRRASS